MNQLPKIEITDALKAELLADFARILKALQVSK